MLSWLIPKKSSASPVTVTRSPAATVGQFPRQKTKMPSEVAGSASASASSSWRKNPSNASSRSNRLVTTPWTCTGPVIATDEPEPWTSWMNTSSGSGSAQALAAPGVMGRDPTRSTLFWSESAPSAHREMLSLASPSSSSPAPEPSVYGDPVSPS